MKTLEKLAADILDEHGCPDVPFDEKVTMYYPAIIEAMQVFHKHALEEWKSGKVKELENHKIYDKYPNEPKEGWNAAINKAIEILKQEQ